MVLTLTDSEKDNANSGLVFKGWIDNIVSVNSLKSSIRFLLIPVTLVIILLVTPFLWLWVRRYNKKITKVINKIRVINHIDDLETYFVIKKFVLSSQNSVKIFDDNHSFNKLKNIPMMVDFFLLYQNINEMTLVFKSLLEKHNHTDIVSKKFVFIPAKELEIERNSAYAYLI